MGVHGCKEVHGCVWVHGWRPGGVLTALRLLTALRKTDTAMTSYLSVMRGDYTNNAPRHVSAGWGLGQPGLSMGGGFHAGVRHHKPGHAPAPFDRHAVLRTRDQYRPLTPAGHDLLQREKHHAPAGNFPVQMEVEHWRKHWLPMLGGHRVVGIKNQGSTCYLNSMMQAAPCRHTTAPCWHALTLANPPLPPGAVRPRLFSRKGSLDG